MKRHFAALQYPDKRNLEAIQAEFMTVNGNRALGFPCDSVIMTGLDIDCSEETVLITIEPVRDHGEFKMYPRQNWHGVNRIGWLQVVPKGAK